MRQTLYIFLYLLIGGAAAAFYYFTIDHDENPLPVIQEAIPPEVKNTFDQINHFMESESKPDDPGTPTKQTAAAPRHTFEEKERTLLDDNTFLIPSPKTVKKLLDDVTTYQDILNERKNEVDRQIKRDTE